MSPPGWTTVRSAEDAPYPGFSPGTHTGMDGTTGRRYRGYTAQSTDTRVRFPASPPIGFWSYEERDAQVIVNLTEVIKSTGEVRPVRTFKIPLQTLSQYVRYLDRNYSSVKVRLNGTTFDLVTFENKRSDYVALVQWEAREEKRG